MHLTRRVLLSGVAVAAGGAAVAVLQNPPPADAVLPAEHGSRIFAIGRFGARSNGSTDDTRAVQAASKAAASVGGTVLFPAGTTVINDLSHWYPGVAYAGADSRAVIRVNGTNGTGPKVTAAGICFHDLTFIRNVSSSPFLRIRAPFCSVQRCTFSESTANTSEGVVVDPGGSQALIEDCTFRSLGAASIFVDGAQGPRIVGNSIHDQRYRHGYRSCIQLVGTVRSASIISNIVMVAKNEPTALNGISLAGGNVLVVGNTVSCSRFSIESRGGVSGTIVQNSCSVSSQAVEGDWNYAAGISLPRSRNLQVSANRIDQRGAGPHAYVGIEVPDASRCEISYNVLVGTPRSPVGVILDSSSNCIVRNNKVTGYTDGLLIYGHGAAASRNRIQCNTIKYSGTSERSYGVAVQLDRTGSADGNMITDNSITGSGSGQAIVLDVQDGKGSIRGTRIKGNSVSRSGAPLHRFGDRGTTFS